MSNELIAELLESSAKKRTIVVNDKMQKGYSYELSMPEGNFSDLQEKFPEFKPFYSPKEMLEMGVFEGKYLRDCHKEFPSSWFTKAKEAKEAKENKAEPDINFFGVKSRKDLSHWKEKNWIIGNDPRGWFQWYCRAYYGRRDPEVDETQVKRWLSFKRHLSQVTLNCKKGDKTCRPVQRQALLQWSYNCKV